jgi:AcrR family transcriptional regulator
MEVGWDAASTQAIADRAGASMGSLFHFFPTKDALLVALGRRYTARMLEANEQAMPSSAVFLPPVPFFEGVIGAQVRLKDQTPVLPRIHEAIRRRFGADAGPMCELDEALYERVRAFCALRLPRLKGARKEATVRLMVGVVHRVMDMSTDLPPDVTKELLVVARDMLAGYLAEADRRYGEARRA